MQLDAVLDIETITNIRELAGDQWGPIRFALKLSGEVPAESALTLYSSEQDRETFAQRYWNEDGDLSIGHTDDTAVLEDEIKLGEASVGSSLGATPPMKFLEANLKQIKLKPLDGRKVHLQASLQIRPADEQMAPLLNMMKMSARVQVQRRQGELPLEGAKKKGGKQKDLLAGALPSKEEEKEAGEAAAELGKGSEAFDGIKVE